jgi:hypothetical protein
MVVAPSATARVSGATVQAGANFEGSCGGVPPAISGFATIPSPADPSLVVSTPLVVGQPFTFTLRGNPGDSARLRVGRTPIVDDSPAAVEDLLVVVLRTHDLGTIPPSGQVQLSYALPANVLTGFLLLAQGATVDGFGESRLTQSVPVVAR